MGAHRASCQCGSLVVEAAEDPDLVIACNCRACQHRSGSPFGSAGYFRRSALNITGEQTVWERKADSGRSITNYFCTTCGSTVYWALEMRPDHLGVAYGCFDKPLPDPIRAIWTEAQHDWVTFPDDWPKYPQGTPE